MAAGDRTVPHTGYDAAAHAQRMRAQGFWIDRTIDDFLVDALARVPDHPAIVAFRADGKPTERLSYRMLGERVSCAAGALQALGVEPGDVVAVQLPNWWEFAVIALACGRIGAVVNPLMPIFRERELGFMLGFSGARVFVVPNRFRGFEHGAMARRLMVELPTLKHVVVVEGGDEDGFERKLLQSGAPALRPGAAPGLKPAELAVLMFTSGTTGEPKGVMHSANTLVACTNALAGRFGLGADAVLLCCSPLGHMTGFAAVLLQSVCLGATAVLQDVWDPRQGVRIMAAEGVTHTAAATPFLADICNAVADGAPRPARLRTFLCGGAPIPSALIERARIELGLSVSSLWGMTESLSSTLTEPARATEKSSSTDGRAVEGVDIAIVDDAGRPAPAGSIGNLKVRGAQMFLGYYKRADLPTFDADGWFDTGDLAYMDDEGYIRISGRTKEVVIRGGENIPVVEIENLLYRHPAIAEAAIVGYPDERLGERACAFVALKPGAHFDLADVHKYMSTCKVAKQYWPERVVVLAAMPRTPSGKIQKFALKARASAFGETAA